MSLQSRVTHTQPIETTPVGRVFPLDKRQPYGGLKTGSVPSHNITNMKPGIYFVYKIDIDNRPGAICLAHVDEVDHVSDVVDAAKLFDTIDLPTNPADAHTVGILHDTSEESSSLVSEVDSPYRFGGVMDIFTKEIDGQVSIVVLDIESQLITTPMFVDTDAPDEFPALSDEPDGLAWDYEVAASVDLSRLESEEDCEVVYLNGMTKDDVKQFTNERMTALRSPGWEDGFVQNINTGTLHLRQPDGSDHHVVFVTDYKPGREGIRDMFKQMNTRAEQYARTRDIMDSISEFNATDKQL